MPEKAYPLEPDGPERLVVSWEGNFKNLELALDGQALGSFEDAKQAKTGRTFALADGSRLHAQLVTSFLWPELRLTRDGDPIPGSASDPHVRHAAAYNMVFAVALLSAVAGLLVEVFGVSFLKAIGVGWSSVLGAGIYAVLGVFVKRGSAAALAAVVALFVLDGLFLLVLGARAGGTPPVGGLVARTFLLIPMLRGFPALRELKRPRRRPRPLPQAAPTRLAGRPAAPAPAARVLTGEAEKRRLQMTERVAAPAATVVGRGPLAHQGRAAVDSAAKALRFLAHKCEIGAAGLRIAQPSGQVRELAYAEIARMVVRQLPPDPPWNSGILVDLVAAAAAGGVQPVRVFNTTFVNYGVLPGGASTARLENVRKLGRHLRERNAAIQIDPETTAFLDGSSVPTRFVNMTRFAEYDATYG